VKRISGKKGGETPYHLRSGLSPTQGSKEKQESERKKMHQRKKGRRRLGTDLGPANSNMGIAGKAVREQTKTIEIKIGGKEKGNSRNTIRPERGAVRTDG